MGERTDEIAGQIQEERDELRANLGELGSRVRSATDWRRQFRHSPMLGVGLAFGVGLLLGSLHRDPVRDEPQRPSRVSSPPHAASASTAGRGQLLNAWEAIQSALIGLAANKVTGVLSEMIPGLREHLSKGAQAFRSHRPGNGHGAWGEGNYEAARRYRAGAEGYARTADVDAAARAAEPRSESEAEELKAAEEMGRSRAKRS